MSNCSKHERDKYDKSEKIKEHYKERLMGK